MKGPLKLLFMKTPLHRPIDPWTNPPGSTCGRSSPQRYPELQRFAGKPGLRSGFCPQVPKRSACLAQWRSPPLLPLTAIVTLIFQVFCRGKVDKLRARHLQALERLLHSQHVFAHQFTSQGIQHFLWAWQRSLSPSNIFKPCTRAYERCMRRTYGTLKNSNSIGPNAHVWSKHDYDMPVERCIAELSEFTQF